MKTVLFFICLFVFFRPVENYTQCVRGDCEKGYGVYKFDNGDIYEGTWKDSRFNGKGKYLWKNGDYREGEYVNGLFEGYGSQFKIKDSILITGNWLRGRLSDGNIIVKIGSKAKYEGESRNEKHHGKGKLTVYGVFSYEGSFENGNFHGSGQIEYEDGSKYIGEFKNDLRDGKGIEYLPNGNKLVGTWRDDEFYQESKISKSNGNTHTVKMKKSESGVYEIPITINDVLKIDFIMDTGAADLFVTPDIALTLIRTKTLTLDDVLEGKEYITADGFSDYHITFNVKEIDIGGYKIKNVTAGISNNIDGMNLLGQSVLEKLRKFTVDYENETFTIGK